MCVCFFYVHVQHEIANPHRWWYPLQIIELYCNSLSINAKYCCRSGFISHCSPIYTHIYERDIKASYTTHDTRIGIKRYRTELHVLQLCLLFKKFNLDRSLLAGHQISFFSSKLRWRCPMLFTSRNVSIA